ncbi:hypothetical protein [Cyanobium sp. ULC084]
MSSHPTQEFLLFLLGGSFFVTGIFLFTNQVMVGSGLRRLASGRLGGAGSGLIFVGTFALGAGGGFGLLQSHLFSFRETCLWSLRVMIGGGGGLMFRSIRGYQEEERQRRTMDQDEAAAKMMDIKEELEQLKIRLDER